NSLVALQNTTLSDIWVAKADGSDARQITSGEAMGFGLDWLGDRIAASNSRLQWVLMNPDGSNAVPLINDGDPHFQLSACADGKHIVYVAWHKGTLELWRADADGSNQAKLAAKGLVGGCLCTPDSKSVLYAAESALWRMPIDGGTPERIDLPGASFV